jgi:hypothetical protein
MPIRDLAEYVNPPVIFAVDAVLMLYLGFIEPDHWYNISKFNIEIELG